MSNSKSQPNWAAILDNTVKFLAQTQGKDKVAKLLQYGSRFIHAVAVESDPKSQLAVKAKKVDVSAGGARRVFRLGNELTEFQRVKALLKTGQFDNISNLLALVRSASMFWYWTLDHLIWFISLGFTKFDQVKVAYYSSLCWGLGLVSALLIDLQALDKIVKQESTLKLDQYKLATTQEAKIVNNQMLKDIRNKKSELLLNCVKNTADLAVAANLLKIYEFNPKRIGIFGIISALIATYQLFPALPRS
eukprot:TRINITY_DN3000_c0_g1_i1.p1 TRINITY_DN3000_c0_g1~~TRINITY_DN3000_c0_g1_i1.p1  ORF type:complete len:248 (+),score=53.17 TRINITY_DN3000_c0_g1_i1:90-833(+)